MESGDAPITDDELLYRRVPACYYDPGNDSKPSPKAFRPRPSDISGLSVTRAKFASTVQVARSGRGKRYAVAVMRAGELRAHGIEVVPRPLRDSPGHAELPELTYENRKNNQQETWQKLMAEELCTMEDPFPPDESEN